MFNVRKRAYMYGKDIADGRGKIENEKRLKTAKGIKIF